MSSKAAQWTSRDIARIQAGLERIAELAVNANDTHNRESLATYEVIAHDLLYQAARGVAVGFAPAEGIQIGLRA